MKKGQVTIFIIIGILILAVSGVILFLNSQKTITSQDQLQSVQNYNMVGFVESCLEKSTIKGLNQVLSNAGYNDLTNIQNVIDFQEEIISLPSYFNQGEINMPSLNTIEQQAAIATIEHFNICIDNFNAFKKEGLKFKIINEPQITIKFITQKTISKLDYDFEVIEKESQKSYDKFQKKINFDFLARYREIETYLNFQKEEDEYFEVSSLSELAYDNDYEFEFSQPNVESSQILLSFEYPQQENDDVINYNFAMNFNWQDESTDELEIEETNYPTINNIKPWFIVTPNTNTIQINATGENLYYELDNSDFTIDQNGLISLDSTQFTNDEYLYYVRVTDENDRTAIAPLYINININDGNQPIIKPLNITSIFFNQTQNLTLEITNKNKGPFIFTSDSQIVDLNNQSGQFTLIPNKDTIGINSVRFNVENEFGLTWYRFDLEILE
jgi:hypothetical protein